MEFRGNQAFEEWARSRGVVAIYLHGSQTRSPRGDSDIDIALLLHGVPDWETTERVREEALDRLAAVLDCPQGSLDIQFLNGAPPAFSFRVIRDRRLLWEGDHKSRVDFERDLLTEYLDFRYYEEQYDRTVRRRLREDTFGRRPEIHRSTVS